MSGRLAIFKMNFLNFIRPCANSIFDIHNSYGIPNKITPRPQSPSRSAIYALLSRLYVIPGCGDDTET